MPPEVRSQLKVDLMEALNEVKSHAIQSNEHGYLNRNTIKEEVESTLASSGFISGTRVNHTASIMGSKGDFDAFTGGPNMQSLTGDDIKTYAYGGFQGNKQDYISRNYDGNIRNTQRISVN